MAFSSRSPASEFTPLLETLTYDGVDHLAGIAMELQQVAFQLTHSQHFANMIKTDEAFVKVAYKELNLSFTHGTVDKKILSNVIPKIYAAMSQEDSRVLYNAT